MGDRDKNALAHASKSRKPSFARKGAEPPKPRRGNAKSKALQTKRQISAMQLKSGQQRVALTLQVLS